jgi:hypothetical protein
MSYRYLTYFKMTTNNENFQINIPLDLNIGESRFVVSGVLGKVAVDNTAVFIHSPELTTTGSWSSINQRNDTLNSCILGTTLSKPINTVTSSQDIGFVSPVGLSQNRRISFQLRDENGDLVTMGASDYVVIVITFYSIGINQMTSNPSLAPLYNYL